MKWKFVRLELAQTPEFPRGSPSRSYLLRVPLDGEGNIDDAEILTSPEVATVRRFWPSERDLRGYLVRTASGWSLSRRPACSLQTGGEFHLPSEPLRLGGSVSVRQPDGSALPFRVASVSEMTVS